MATTQSRAEASRQGLFPRILLLGALLVPLLTGILLSWHSMGALDVWLHNQVGHDILSGKGFPTTNTFSYTEPNHPWTNHEWLFQVVVGLLGPDIDQPITEGIGRWNLLRSLLTAILLIVLVFGDSVWRRLGRHPGTSWAHCWLALPLLLGVLLLWPRLTLRPELFSYLILVILVRDLDQPLAHWTPQGNWLDLVSPRRPLGLALWLTIIWTQFHGFSSLAPVILLTAMLAGLLEKVLFRPRGNQETLQGRWWLLGVPLLLLGLCISPNGVHGLVYPLKALGQFRGSEVDLRSTISELTPLLETRDSLGTTLVAYKLSLAWGLIWVAVTWGQTSLLRILLWAAAAVAAYHGQRNIGIYGVTFILLHTGTTGIPLWSRLPVNLRKIPGFIPALAALGIAMLAAVPWWGQIVGDEFYLSEGVSRRFGSGANPGRYPETAAQVLRQASGTYVFTNVDAAAFLLNRGQARVFIDGRTEAYSTDRWVTYEAIKRGDDVALSLLEKSQPQRIFISSGGGTFRTLTRTLLQDSGWNLDYRDETGFFFRPRTVEEKSLATLDHVISLNSLETALPDRATDLTSARAADLCLAWAIVMEVGGDPKLQEVALRRGLEFRPEHPQLQHNLGNILMAAGDNVQALPLFRGALRVNGRLAGSALNAGVCLLRLGEAQQARQMFSRATRIDPRNFQAWANLGVACQALGDRQGAIQALEKAVLLEPRNQRLSNMLQQLRSVS